jgi:large subunit ribosomal protein L17
MRHRCQKSKLSRNSSHRRCLFANMLKSLIDSGRINTTVAKAKQLRRYADRMVTLAKENTLASRRRAIAHMMVQFNALEPSEARAAKAGDHSAYNADRRVIEKLFGEIGPRFAARQGGYTRMVKSGLRVGDNAQTCVIEFLPE